MNRNRNLQLANAGMIAALYVVLTWIANLAGLASGAIQVRLSEALTILPVFTASAVPGLTVGCVLANLLTGCAAWDVVFGSLATLIGAVGTRLLKNKPMLAWIPPVVSNMAIVPIILIKVYGVPDAWWFLVLTVGAGEVISCGLLGLLLWKALKNVPQIRGMK
ncbi:MAG: QueT transporter family protein [Clostridiales bacterium]|nr:QueT transporter family protein [Clostridiales bacterium]